MLVGVLTAGIADSFANAAGMHVSQETEVIHTKKEVFKSTVYCFFATILTTLVLSLPIMIFSFEISLYISIGLGVVLLIALGIFVSKLNNKFKPHLLALEYLFIGIVVSIICYVIGMYANNILL